MSETFSKNPCVCQNLFVPLHRKICQLILFPLTISDPKYQEKAVEKIKKNFEPADVPVSEFLFHIIDFEKALRESAKGFDEYYGNKPLMKIVYDLYSSSKGIIKETDILEIKKMISLRNLIVHQGYKEDVDGNLDENLQRITKEIKSYLKSEESHKN